MMGARSYTKEDVIKLVQEKNVRIVNLCHIPEDGRLKKLGFAVNNEERLREILEFGERVDGSSLFSYIDEDKSDVYIIPKIESAFFDPFSTTPTLNFLCTYMDENGNSLNVAPQTVLARAEEKLRSSTGITLEALAELEFYVISKGEETIFPETSDRHYHEASPMSRFESLRNEVLVILDDIGIATKYGHAEGGKFRSRAGYSMEQHEIEFQPQDLDRMADSIAIAKWVIRNVGTKHGALVSFSPKLAPEHAGTGMHLHLCGLKDERNVIVDSKGKLSIEAKQMIGGLLKLAPSLAAFGNTIPVSYLRFIARKESPAHICWGTKNRLALIRIPLWWSFKKDFEANGCRRTFEYRGPDASANGHLLMAGIAVAIEYGLRYSKEAMKIADELNIDSKAKERKLDLLPLSCAEAADNLQRDRKYYEADGVFPERVIDGTTSKLRSYKDEGLSKRFAAEPEKVEDMLWEYTNYG